MTTLIAIPYYGVPAELIDKAAKHALAQTADCVVLIAGDGQAPPVSVKSDRLVVGTFPTNLGAPATQQAMILGSPFQWYSPMGADDWIEPDHVASLLRLGTKVNGSGVIYYHEGRKVSVLRSPRTFIEFGVLDTALLKSIGGYNAAEPCGQDSVLISLLVKMARFRLSTRPTYHKQWRADSLTHAAGTRQGSTIREGVKARNRVVINHCAQLGWRIPAIRAYRDGLVAADLRSELEDRANDVSKWLT